MKITTEWTPQERLTVIEAIARRVEAMTTSNALKYRAEIANGAFLIRCVAVQSRAACEANRGAIMAAAAEEAAYNG